MEQLDLNQIRTFVKLVEAGSFTKAAAVLKQPKSRVSRKLAGLETELGVQLVVRTTRQFQLTDLGRRFYDKAKSLIEGLENITDQLGSEIQDIAGPIKVTASDDMGARLLPEILNDFMTLYPKVFFEVYLTQEFVDLVKEGVDVALRIGVLKDSSLKARKVGTVQRILVAAPQLVERLRLEKLDRLAVAPYLALNQERQKIELVDSEKHTKVSLPIVPMISANNPALLVEMVLAGKGYGYIPRYLCQEYIRRGELLHLHRHLRSSDAGVHIVTVNTKEAPARVRKFSDYLYLRLKDFSF